MTINCRTFVLMETKVETTNNDGKVLAYECEKIVGQLDFTFKGNTMSIDHTHAFEEGIGVGALLVNAANNYAVNHKLSVIPACSFAEAWYKRHPQFNDILANGK